MRIKILPKFIYSGLILLAVIFSVSVFLGEFSPRFSQSGKFKNNYPGEVGQAGADGKAMIIKLADNFFNREVFFNAVEKAEKTGVKDNIQAVIVPHHLVVAEYIAKLIKEASGRPINKAVIIGPNHNNIGTSPLITAKIDWETPFGSLNYDPMLVNKFLADFNGNSYPEVFTNEHSIGAIIPFVKYYLKNIRVVPIVVSSYVQYSDIEKLSEWLNENIDSNTLVIYSIDFSHYLREEEADQKDEVTKALIIEKDIGKILKLDNDYVDSPGILALSLMHATNRELKINFVYQGNSFDFAAIKPEATTSYFGISFQNK